MADHGQGRQPGEVSQAALAPTLRNAAACSRESDDFVASEHYHPDLLVEPRQ